MKHVHSKAIKAWANGKVLEELSSNNMGNDWTVVETPSWGEDCQYRIKQFSEKPFTKKDLKNGMIVEYRDGNRRLVIEGVLIADNGFLSLSRYSSKLKLKNRSSPYLDIMKVYTTNLGALSSMLELNQNPELVWSR